MPLSAVRPLRKLGDRALLEEPARCASSASASAASVPCGQHQRQEQALGGDEGITLLFRRRPRPGPTGAPLSGRQVHLARALPCDLGQLLERSFRVPRVHARSAARGSPPADAIRLRRQALGIVEQDL